MLTFKMILMWLCTFTLIVLGTLIIGTCLSVLISEETKGPTPRAGIAWLISSLLLSVTCMRLAF